MKLNVEELAREAGFEQVMRHKNGNSTVLPTPMFERLTRLIVERCAKAADDLALPDGIDLSGLMPSGAWEHGTIDAAAAIRNLLED